MTYQTAAVSAVRTALAAMLLVLCQVATADSRWGIDAVSGIDCFLVEKARIVEDDRNEGRFGHANVGHQISHGNNMVLAIRGYENGGRGPDDQRFKKATLEFAQIPNILTVGQGNKVSVLRSYYTEGASGFVTQSRYARAVNAFSNFQIVRGKRAMEVILNTIVQVKDAAKRQDRQATVAWTCPVILRTVEQLDVWEGKAGTTWGSFFPRNPPPSQAGTGR